MAKTAADGVKIICENKNARRNYEILDDFEAGIVLRGTEVKSLRDGRVNLKDSYARLRNGEVYLIGAHITPYSHGTHENHDPLRERKLLLHRQEIRKLTSKVLERGLTLVPLRLYFRRGIAKVKLGLGRGRQAPDKRKVLKDRAVQREVEQAIKRHR